MFLHEYGDSPFSRTLVLLTTPEKCVIMYIHNKEGRIVMAKKTGGVLYTKQRHFGDLRHSGLEKKDKFDVFVSVKEPHNSDIKLNVVQPILSGGMKVYVDFVSKGSKRSEFINFSAEMNKIRDKAKAMVIVLTKKNKNNRWSHLMEFFSISDIPVAVYRMDEVEIPTHLIGYEVFDHPNELYQWTKRVKREVY